MTPFCLVNRWACHCVRGTCFLLPQSSEYLVYLIRENPIPRALFTTPSCDFIIAWNLCLPGTILMQINMHKGSWIKKKLNCEVSLPVKFSVSIVIPGHNEVILSDHLKRAQSHRAHLQKPHIISKSLKFSKIFEGPLFTSETLNGVLSEWISINDDLCFLRYEIRMRNLPKTMQERFLFDCHVQSVRPNPWKEHVNGLLTVCHP